MRWQSQALALCRSSSEGKPLVVEIWSPSTGAYDINEKLADYQQRGDLEIWRIHPYERTLTAWRRMPDGAFAESLYRGGIVQTASLPGVVINLDALFAESSGAGRDRPRITCLTRDEFAQPSRSHPFPQGPHPEPRGW